MTSKFKVGDTVINPEDYPGFTFKITSVRGNEYLYDIHKDGKFQESFHFPVDKFDGEKNKLQSKLERVLT